MEENLSDFPWGKISRAKEKKKSKKKIKIPHHKPKGTCQLYSRNWRDHSSKKRIRLSPIKARMDWIFTATWTESGGVLSLFGVFFFFPFPAVAKIGRKNIHNTVPKVTPFQWDQCLHPPSRSTNFDNYKTALLFTVTPQAMWNIYTFG